MVPMYLGKADVNAYDKGASREFLVSNGRGSYAFSTIIGVNTRKEHGLLVTRPENEIQHQVLVGKVEETLYAHGKKYQLSTNRYKDVIYPDGYRYIQEYQSTPLPTILFTVHSILLRKTIFMPCDAECTVIKYELLASPERVKLELRPLFAHRGCNKGRLEGDLHPPFAFSISPQGILSVDGSNLQSHVSLTQGEWFSKPLWFDNLLYENEEGNGVRFSYDNLWSPGFFSIDLEEGNTIYMLLSPSVAAASHSEIERMEEQTVQKLTHFAKKAQINLSSTTASDMIASACHLIGRGKDGIPVLFSGYPSLKLKARDTFVALPGVTLVSGRPHEALAILASWIDLAVKTNHVMPSRIDDRGMPVLESADAGLWFLYGVGKFLEYTNAYNEIEKWWPDIRKLFDRYLDGIPEIGLRSEENGLLFVEDEQPGRHWMDGVTDSGELVVKRHGFLVELNALWYNAIRLMERLAEIFDKGNVSTEYSKKADLVRKSFVELFWNAPGGYLFDWVDPNLGIKDDTVRPNQILAISLPATPIEPEMGRSILEICWNELYTTYGLRTLDPHHDKFKGRYEGRPDQKAKARFRGMAWPWLLGQFITAYLKYNPDRKDIAWTFVRPFNAHLRHGCLGGVAELFDGIMPYDPHGDVLSAMSHGELLRILHEDLFVRPSYNLNK